MQWIRGIHASVCGCFIARASTMRIGTVVAKRRWDFPFSRQLSFRLPQAVCEAPLNWACSSVARQLS